MNFAEKVVLVAGGTGGLGRSVALAFLGAGARVAVTYRRDAELDALKESARESAERLSGHPIDATDETAARGLVDELIARHRRLDVLVNAVGGYTGGAPLWEMEASALDRMLLANLRSVGTCTIRASPDVRDLARCCAW